MSHMKWTKLRSRIRGTLAPSLADRLDIHQARYGSKEEEGRVWFTWDGEEIASFDSFKYWTLYPARKKALWKEIESDLSIDMNDALNKLDVELINEGVYTDWTALTELQDYLNLSIGEALESPSPLSRAVAMVDRRLGKRTLTRLAANDEWYPLANRLLRIRFDAEGMPWRT
jgi:hypothetical protein